MKQLLTKVREEREEKDGEGEIPLRKRKSFEESKKGFTNRKNSSEGEIPMEEMISQQRPSIQLLASDSEEEEFEGSPIENSPEVHRSNRPSETQLLEMLNKQAVEKSKGANKRL